jgi:ATP-dependent exoDNAse (exonuclease V) alpha subunit
MAIYHLHIKSISRSDGRTATGAAAYRAGERIRDERTGVLHNHAHRVDVSHKEIVLPARLHGVEPEWVKERASLWNAAERAEGRRNARVAREYEVALPAELTPAQRVHLAQTFARELADRHNTAVDLAVHEPRPAGDARNHHAHLLETTREIRAEGFGAKSGLDMQQRTRQQRALPPAIVEFNLIRERWAARVNEALQAAGLSERVDHRSYQARGIDREPMAHIPYAAVQSERHGMRSEIAERLRESYRERVQQRLQREQEAERTAGPTAEPSPPAASSGPQTLEELRQRAREAWLQMRQAMSQSARSPDALERGVDDADLSL